MLVLGLIGSAFATSCGGFTTVETNIPLAEYVVHGRVTWVSGGRSLFWGKHLPRTVRIQVIEGFLGAERGDMMELVDTTEEWEWPTDVGWGDEVFVVNGGRSLGGPCSSTARVRGSFTSSKRIQELVDRHFDEKRKAELFRKYAWEPVRWPWVVGGLAVLGLAGLVRSRWSS